MLRAATADEEDVVPARDRGLGIPCRQARKGPRAARVRCGRFKTGSSNERRLAGP
ncbi:MAG: hypothetical protein M0C28_02970 [Candidatus Moduliflexus flocculans]|nr:hypothetical protein [Candidatus Moduliflexus flocculans]